MVIMNDLEWPMLSYYVIYYERFRKDMQRTEKVALSWKWYCMLYYIAKYQILLLSTCHTTSLNMCPSMCQLFVLWYKVSPPFHHTGNTYLLLAVCYLFRCSLMWLLPDPLSGGTLPGSLLIDSLALTLSGDTLTLVLSLTLPFIRWNPYSSPFSYIALY